MHECKYVTNCTESRTGDKINEMVESATEITLRTFVLHVDLSDLYAALPYERDPRKGMTLKQDYHVRFYKSTFDGSPCYYVNWSSIEFVFAA